MEPSGVQFNLMNTSVVLVAGIGWHEALSPVKFKTVTTISIVVLWVWIKLKNFVLVFLSFPNLVPKAPAHKGRAGRLKTWEWGWIFPTISRICLFCKKCYGIFFQGWITMLPNEVNVPHKTLNQLMVSPNRLILILKFKLHSKAWGGKNKRNHMYQGWGMNIISFVLFLQTSEFWCQN